MPKVKVWGGTHPDELGPMLLADSLANEPIPNVSSGIVNNIGRRLGMRVVSINMNAAYPGHPDAELAEERRAHHVLAASKGHDIVLDMHSIQGDSNESYACIGSRGASRQLFGFMGQLGIRHLVSAEFNQLIQHVPHGALLDLGPRNYDNLDALRRALDDLANGPGRETADPTDFTWFAHGDGAHEDQFHPDDLTFDPQPFERIPEEIATYFRNDPSDQRSLHWLGKPSKTPNDQGYWAELGWPIDVPDNLR